MIIDSHTHIFSRFRGGKPKTFHESVGHTDVYRESDYHPGGPGGIR